MPTPLSNRPRKRVTRAIDATLKKVLEDYSDMRVIYDTIELHHPKFTGQHTVNNSYYLVNHTDKVIRGGITYLNFAYAIELPEVGDNAQQTINISLDNIDQLVQKGIERAIADPQPIKLTYRLFVEGDGAVKVGPIELHVQQVSVTDQTVTLECSRPDLFKRVFPVGVRYDNKFKGLFV